MCIINRENDIITFGTVPYEGGIAYKFKRCNINNNDDEEPINKRIKVDESTSVNETDIRTSIVYEKWKKNNISTDKYINISIIIYIYIYYIL